MITVTPSELNRATKLLFIYCHSLPGSLPAPRYYYFAWEQEAEVVLPISGPEGTSNFHWGGGCIKNAADGEQKAAKKALWTFRSKILLEQEKNRYVPFSISKYIQKTQIPPTQDAVFNLLGDDSLRLLFSFTPHDLNSFRCTCIRWNAAIDQPFYWQYLWDLLSANHPHKSVLHKKLVLDIVCPPAVFFTVFTKHKKINNTTGRNRYQLRKHWTVFHKGFMISFPWINWNQFTHFYTWHQFISHASFTATKLHAADKIPGRYYSVLPCNPGPIYCVHTEFFFNQVRRGRQYFKVICRSIDGRGIEIYMNHDSFGFLESADQEAIFWA